jgi:phage FluMu gp28-like protein
MDIHGTAGGIRAHSRTTRRDSQTTPIIPLTSYQSDWIHDSSRFKIAVKSRRIGFTFAATLEIACDIIQRQTRWLIISRTQDTAKEALREVGKHLRVMKRMKEAKINDSSTGSMLDGVQIHCYSISLSNGSEVTAMTAHPDATRGFGGNILLDEHAFHRDAKELYKGAMGSTLLGHRLLIISTPNHQNGNYYELAQQAGLTAGVPPAVNPSRHGIWSAHWVDIVMAAPQLRAIGLPINLEEQRQLAGDDDAWQQEFCCQFLAPMERWLSLEMIADARSPLANFEWDPDRVYDGDLYIGADIGRRRDRTAIWIDQRVANNVSICRGVVLLDQTPFERQFEVFCDLLKHPQVRRASIDQTGIGLSLVERLQSKFGGRVEGITFTSANKEQMSVLVRQRFEQHLDYIPQNHPEIERDLAAIKRMATSFGTLRFDAERVENSHADIYWAKALADAAAEQPVTHLTPDMIVLGPRRPVEFQLVPGWTHNIGHSFNPDEEF